MGEYRPCRYKLKGCYPDCYPGLHALIACQTRDLFEDEKLFATEQDGLNAWLKECEKYKDIDIGPVSFVTTYYIYLGKKQDRPEPTVEAYIERLREILRYHNIEMTEEIRDIFKFYIN